MHQKLSASKFWRMSAESLERSYVSGFLSPAVKGEGEGRRKREEEEEEREGRADNGSLQKNYSSQNEKSKWALYT